MWSYQSNSRQSGLDHPGLWNGNNNLVCVAKPYMCNLSCRVHKLFIVKCSHNVTLVTPKDKSSKGMQVTWVSMVYPLWLSGMETEASISYTIYNKIILHCTRHKLRAHFIYSCIIIQITCNILIQLYCICKGALGLYPLVSCLQIWHKPHGCTIRVTV